MFLCINLSSVSVAVSGFLPGGGEFFLEISSGGGDNLPGGGEKIAL